MKSVRFICLEDRHAGWNHSQRHWIHREWMEQECIKQGWNIHTPGGQPMIPDEPADTDVAYIWGPYEYLNDRITASECVVSARGLQDEWMLQHINSLAPIRHVFHTSKTYMDRMEAENPGKWPRSLTPPSPQQPHVPGTEDPIYDLVVFGGTYGWSHRADVVNIILNETDLTVGIVGTYWREESVPGYFDWIKKGRLHFKASAIPLVELGNWLNKGRITYYMNPRWFEQGIANNAMFEMVLASDTLCVPEKNEDFKNLFTFKVPTIPHWQDPNFAKVVLERLTYFIAHQDEAGDIAKQMRADLNQFTMEKNVKHMGEVINAL